MFSKRSVIIEKIKAPSRSAKSGVMSDTVTFRYCFIDLGLSVSSWFRIIGSICFNIPFLFNFVMLQQYNCKYYSSFQLENTRLYFLLCPNGRKKSHCMLARRTACSPLTQSSEIFIPPASTGKNFHNARFNGQNIHTVRFNGQNVHTVRHLTARG